jgi:hypothetical protein
MGGQLVDGCSCRNDAENGLNFFRYSVLHSTNVDFDVGRMFASCAHSRSLLTSVTKSKTVDFAKDILSATMIIPPNLDAAHRFFQSLVKPQKLNQLIFEKSLSSVAAINELFIGWDDTESIFRLLVIRGDGSWRCLICTRQNGKTCRHARRFETLSDQQLEEFAEHSVFIKPTGFTG